MNRLLCLLLLLIPCCPAQAQITLTETKVQVVTGLVEPQVVGDSILIGAESKPVVQAASLIELKAEKTYKFSSLEAENVENFSLADLQQIDETHWLLVGSGRYRVSALAFDPDLARARLFLDLGPTPAPPEPDEPDPPTPDDLSSVAKESRLAMQVFVQSMAGNFNQLASETRLGKYRTVLDASGAANALDVISRNQFKAAMAKVMQPKLGSAELPADAAQTFEEIAIGFKEVK